MSKLAISLLMVGLVLVPASGVTITEVDLGEGYFVGGFMLTDGAAATLLFQPGTLPGHLLLSLVVTDIDGTEVDGSPFVVLLPYFGAPPDNVTVQGDGNKVYAWVSWETMLTIPKVHLYVWDLGNYTIVRETRGETWYFPMVTLHTANAPPASGH